MLISYSINRGIYKIYKCIILFLLSSFLFGDDLPNFPGGYVGMSINYGSNKTLGCQLSFGIAEPSVGEASMGPFLFPGIACGYRYSSINKQNYYYADFQFTLFAMGTWGGAATGMAFINGERFRRNKGYFGYLFGGYIRDYINSPQKNHFYNGAHLGMAIPIIGTHFYP